MLARRHVWGVMGLVVAGLLALQPVRAQGPGGPGGQGPGRMGGARMGFGQGASMMGLLQGEQVRQELKVTEDQAAKIEALAEELRAARPAVQQGMQDLTAEQREARMTQMREEAQKQAQLARERLGSILTPEQMKRLAGIQVQIQGTLASLGDPKIGEALGLTSEQKEKLAALRQAQMTAMRERVRGGQRDAAAPTDRPAWAQAREESETKALAILTDGQRQKLAEIKGAPFVLQRPAAGQRERRARPE